MVFFVVYKCKGVVDAVFTAYSKKNQQYDRAKKEACNLDTRGYSKGCGYNDGISKVISPEIGK
ncbi:MAG: hypothetical protein JZU65_14965 [Chlorobium sp.]|jgi:hypothetical protein|nr:hypothetical protein [Chlorobium sp.]